MYLYFCKEVLIKDVISWGMIVKEKKKVRIMLWMPQGKKFQITEFLALVTTWHSHPRIFSYYLRQPWSSECVSWGARALGVRGWGLQPSLRSDIQVEIWRMMGVGREEGTPGRGEGVWEAPRPECVTHWQPKTGRVVQLEGTCQETNDETGSWAGM